MSDAPATHHLRPLVRPLVTLAALTVALVLPAFGLTAPPTSSAEASAACDGVTVRVERSGSTKDRCAPGAPANGLHALRDAGFSYTEVPGQAGMVCTIDGHPEACNGAPVDAYWSYWHADAGARSWTYASRGAGNRTPAPGSHDAWVFGAGSPPSTPPPAAPAPSPSPTETSPPKGGSGGSSSGGSGSGGSSSGGSSSGGSSSGGSSSGGSSSGGSSSGGSSAGGSNDSGSNDSRSNDSGSNDSRSNGGSAPDVRTRSSASDEDEREQRDGSSGEGSAAASEEDRDADDGTSGDADDPAEGDDPDEADGTAETDEDARPGGPESPDEDLRSASADDTVSIQAPGGGRAGLGALAGGALALGVAAAGAIQVRRRRAELGPDA